MLTTDDIKAILAASKSRLDAVFDKDCACTRCTVDREVSRLCLHAQSLQTENDRLKKRHLANIKARDDARAEAAAALNRVIEINETLTDLQWKHQVPDGAKRLDAWEYKGQLIVMGIPAEGTGDVDGENQHNCDAMGCSSVGHVVIRQPMAGLLEAGPQEQIAFLQRRIDILSKGGK